MDFDSPHNENGTTDDFYAPAGDAHDNGAEACYCDRCNAKWARLERKAATR